MTQPDVVLQPAEFRLKHFLHVLAAETVPYVEVERT
jgi:hypothetical protein